MVVRMHGKHNKIRKSASPHNKNLYDEKRRWLSTIETKKGNVKLQNIDYTFDLVGNVKKYENNAGVYTTEQNYTYDALYQLTSVEGTSRNYRNNVLEYTARYSQTYSFDSQGLGNMTLKTSATANSNGMLLGDPLDYRFAYEYENGYAHRAKQIGERYYQYDRNGNVTVEQDGPFEASVRTGNAGVKRIGDVNYVEEAWGIDANAGGGSAGQKYRREYTWDERNRLAVSADGRYNVQYTYDHSGERTGKYAAGTSGSRNETLYYSKLWTWTHSGLWTDSQGRYSKHIFLGESRIATKIVAGDGHHVPRAEELRQYYYHSDHLGSAQLITNYAGEEYERLEYTPYGELWIEKAAEASVLDIAYRFTGKERDEETGNYYYGARYLDPRTSRWLSTDPAMGDYVPGAPINDEAKKRNGNLPGQGGVFNHVNFHVYHYAANNPVVYVDPDGDYDRQAAVAYAKQWATDRNPKYFGYPRDCANFVSQSLFAGGIKQTASWYSKFLGTKSDDFGLYSMSRQYGDITLSWSTVEGLLDHFSDPQNGYSDGMVTVDKNNLSAVANNGEVQVGDIMIFARKNGDDPHHAAIVTGIKDGEISFSAHSNPREDAKLSKYIGNEQVIIIKMKNEAE